MLLNEFFDAALKQTAEQRYDNAEDQSLMKPETTRRSRLTLREINKLRQMKELKTVETKLQNEFIASMYSQPEQAPGL
jgi:ribosomal protein S7